MGKETILTLAKHGPESIYFTGRSATSATVLINEAEAIAPQTKLTFIECDFTSLSSVKEAAHRFSRARLDVLVCNCGIMAAPPGLTKDGYEVQFGVNHLAHALLIKLLMPVLQQTAEREGDARIVSLTSLGMKMPPKGGIVFKDLGTTQEYGMASAWYRYGQSKLANVLYATELARRYPAVTSVSVHPGTINTGLVSNLGFLNRLLVYVTNIGKMIPLEQGVYNTCWAATARKEDLLNGAYYEPVGKLGEHTKESSSEPLAGELWKWTQKQLEQFKH